MSKEVSPEVIGSDAYDLAEFDGKQGLSFLNLRGRQDAEAGFAKKAFRVALYYARLIHYAAKAKPKIFHILWNNRIQFVDRTLLMLYYKLLGKKIVFTAHNVNAGKRDSHDTPINRLTLRIQYRLTDHIFVHTEQMKRELTEEFGVETKRITVIPFGLNNAVPNTHLTAVEAKRRLGIRENEKTILFFGRITPYKGLEYLVEAFQNVAAKEHNSRLIIAGWPDKREAYWKGIREAIEEDVKRGRILLRPEFVPDDETEVYFKAADVLVLPYRDIYQSGVLFLGQSFGLPVLAADVGSLKDDIVEGKTGFVFRPEDPGHLAETLERYFASELYANLDDRRRVIRNWAQERHSWETVSNITANVYSSLARTHLLQVKAQREGDETDKLLTAAERGNHP